MFAYCGNNPVNAIDSSGYFFSSILKKIKKTWNSFKKFNDKAKEAVSDFKLEDGKYALDDNHRREPDKIFHSQLSVVGVTPPSLDLKEGDVGIGAIEGDFLTGGWETEYLDVSLFDFGHAEAGLHCSEEKISAGAMASIWSPSIELTFDDFSIGLGAEVGSVGCGFYKNDKGFSLKGSYMIGGSFILEWE